MLGLWCWCLVFYLSGCYGEDGGDDGLLVFMEVEVYEDDVLVFGGWVFVGDLFFLVFCVLVVFFIKVLVLGLGSGGNGLECEGLEEFGLVK